MVFHRLFRRVVLYVDGQVSLQKHLLTSFSNHSRDSYNYNVIVIQLYEFQDLIYKAQGRHARNYKTLHQAEDVVAFCVKINDHPYL